MKVLHVYKTFFPDTHGGLEEVIRQICLNAVDYGVESRIFALSPKPSPSLLKVGGVSVVRARQTFEVASCGFCFHGLGEFREQAAWADVVHYHFPWPFADVMYLLHGSKTPSIVTYHSDIVRQRILQNLYRPLMYRFLGSMSRIIATSPNYRATSKVLDRFLDKVEVIPIGIDESCRPRQPDEGRLQALRDDVGENFFLFVGVLRYYKGLHFLLEAVKDANYQVLIVGSGPMEKALKKQAKLMKLDNVRFCGYVDNDTKMLLFQLCRGVVFPSHLRSEAFGVALLEGAMCGKPLLSTETGSGSSHINLNGKTGYVVPPGCPQALREGLDKLYYNPRRSAAMGQTARRRYLKLFGGRLMGERYAQVYREVLAERELSAGRYADSL
ncbi:MAG: glycosyltransferase [Halieaceae bacterium]|nr:glycosyltransferase [Halieaceae bacterium]